jgi:cell filamentation protein
MIAGSAYDSCLNIELFHTVPIAKGNSFFARPEHIGPDLQKQFHQLAGERCLRGSDSKEFCQRAAYYLGEINALHPFREGNGRAQCVFVRELAFASRL